MTKSQVVSGKGVLGEVSGFFGIVEAQGRGSLHVHMLTWLKHVPNANDMPALLQSNEFRERIITYLKRNIHSDLEDFDEEFVKLTTGEVGVSYSRPLDPDASRWKDRFKEVERIMARTYDVHVCKTSTCL